jgi:hypothetical protein
MDIIKDTDLELFHKNIEKIQSQVKDKVFKLIKPTGDEKLEVVYKVIQFVKNKKRKIYGSYSHNAIIEHRSKDAGFLSSNEIPDIDFYSPEPLKDLYDICNMFHAQGYNNVIGQEAQHAETYKIFVNEIEACDISYVPKIIYNKIPYV